MSLLNYIILHPQLYYFTSLDRGISKVHMGIFVPVICPSSSFSSFYKRRKFYKVLWVFSSFTPSLEIGKLLHLYPQYLESYSSTGMGGCERSEWIATVRPTHIKPNCSNECHPLHWHFPIFYSIRIWSHPKIEYTDNSDTPLIILVILFSILWWD